MRLDARTDFARRVPERYVRASSTVRSASQHTSLRRPSASPSEPAARTSMSPRETSSRIVEDQRDVLVPCTPRDRRHRARECRGSRGRVRPDGSTVTRVADADGARLRCGPCSRGSCVADGPRTNCTGKRNGALCGASDTDAVSSISSSVGPGTSEVRAALDHLVAVRAPTAERSACSSRCPSASRELRGNRADDALVGVLP